MSTRSTYRVIEKRVYEGKLYKTKLVLLYVQCDGYPEGHPMNTAEWLSNGTVIDGLSMNQPKLVFNGPGCLAAQLVTKYKNGAGGSYIYPIGHRGKCGEDFTYDIVIDSDTKTIEFIAYDVTDGWNNKPPRFKKLFTGTPAQYVKWIEDVYSKQK